MLLQRLNNETGLELTTERVIPKRHLHGEDGHNDHLEKGFSVCQRSLLLTLDHGH